MSPGRLEIRREDGALVIALSGDVDLFNAGDLRSAILSELSNERDEVIVDLSRTRYMDSAGIRMLFSLARRLEGRRRRLAIVVPSGSHIRRMLALVDIAARAGLYPSMDEARSALDPG